MGALAINKQKSLYDDIVKIYDLTENIIDVIEEEDAEYPELQLQLSEGVITQLGESADVLVESYIDWIEKNQIATIDDVKKVERAIRKAFNAGTEFQNKLNKIKPRDTKRKHKAYKDNILPSQLLPNIGEGPGELIPGGMWNTFEGHIKRLPFLEGLIRAVRSALSHFWRIVYFFARIKNGLIQNPNNVIWGRTIPDMKAQAILEKQRLLQRREQDLTKAEKAVDLMSKNQDGGMTHS